MAEATSRNVQVLLRDLGMGESPRWHDGRLWFSDWGTNEIIALDLDGHHEVIGPGGGGSGWAVNWLPDGRMLVTGAELQRVSPTDRVSGTPTSATSRRSAGANSRSTGVGTPM